MKFEFATASRILFGPGTLPEAGPAAAELGRRALVAAQNPDRAQPLLDHLKSSGLAVVPFRVEGEPTTGLVQEATELARREACDLVVGFGGGSAMDTAKAVAALLTNPGDPLLYLEVVGEGRPLENDPAPCIAIPTTAGTGSEVTRNAVLGVPEHNVKVSLRSAKMLPDLALVDPELTYSLPPEATASTGMDALTQLMEAYVTRRHNPLTDAICREGMLRAAGSLRRAYRDGKDAEARENMSLASLFSGLALANAKLGAVHGFAGALGGMIDASHGAICASLLPAAWEVNVEAVRVRQPASETLRRFDDVAQLLTGDPTATAGDATGWLRELKRDLNVPSLSELGLRRDQFDELIEKARVSSSMQGNPLELTSRELQRILTAAF